MIVILIICHVVSQMILRIRIYWYFWIYKYIKGLFRDWDCLNEITKNATQYDHFCCFLSSLSLANHSSSTNSKSKHRHDCHQIILSYISSSSCYITIIIQKSRDRLTDWPTDHFISSQLVLSFFELPIIIINDCLLLRT